MQSIHKVEQNDFRVGDNVWDVVHGKGVVSTVDNQETAFPVEVSFDDVGLVRWFTFDGRYVENAVRTLFFSKPRIAGDTVRPFKPTLIGRQVVLEFINGIRIATSAIIEETTDTITIKCQDTVVFKKDLAAIYEVSSENLLTK